MYLLFLPHEDELLLEGVFVNIDSTLHELKKQLKVLTTAPASVVTSVDESLLPGWPLVDVPNQDSFSLVGARVRVYWREVEDTPELRRRLLRSIPCGKRPSIVYKFAATLTRTDVPQHAHYFSELLVGFW